MKLLARNSPGVLGLVLATAQWTASGQTTAGERLYSAQECAGIDLERAGYTVGTSSVEHPFAYLRSIRKKVDDTEARIAQLVNGKPFTYGVMRDQVLDELEKEGFLPDIPGFFRVSVTFMQVSHCDPARKTLDLIYRVYSTAPPKILSGSAESQKTAEKTPQKAAGLTQLGSPVHFTPAGGYNSSEQLFGGGRIEVTRPIKGFPVIHSMIAEGQGSSSMHRVSLALEGSATSLRNFARWDWRLNYLTSSNPAKPGELRESRLSGQFSGLSRPFWGGNVAARFGALVEGGNLHGTFSQASLAADTIAASGFGALKFYGGLISRLRHNVLSASYGLELGSVGAAASVDWRKHVGDLVDEFWIPIGDHRALEIEARFTAGAIQVPNKIPVAERFFGGNQQTWFIPGDSWQIAAAPIIRAIPADRLYLTKRGVGAENFASINLTASYPIKVRPLVPSEVAREVKPLLEGQIKTAASSEQNYFSWKDPAFQDILATVEPLRKALADLKTAVTAAQTAHPGVLKAEINKCILRIGLADFNAKKVPAAKGATQYGFAVEPLRTTKPLVDACDAALAPALNSQAIKDAVGALEGIQSTIRDKDKAIRARASVKSDNDIRFVRRTIDTLFTDLNVYSIAPVVVFDVARIGPAGAGIDGLRYGPGGGVRLELASYVNFTVGYAWNANRRPGEGVGALFFSIGIRDLFH